MADHIERACSICGSYLHHESNCQEKSYWPKVNEIEYGKIADAFMEWKKMCGVGGWYQITDRSHFLDFIKYQIAIQVERSREKLSVK